MEKVLLFLIFIGLVIFIGGRILAGKAKTTVEFEQLLEELDFQKLESTLDKDKSDVENIKELRKKYNLTLVQGKILFDKLKK